jgi:magnesium-protoporphyrin O-methyltransferase
VACYFDDTAHATWARLTSDAPVSRIRATVRAGRDEMRALMLSRLPADLAGMRVLDAGCGAGQMTARLAARGADVLAVDISPRLTELAAARLPEGLTGRVTFRAGDMFDASLGRFDAVLAQDSMIYYDAPTLAARLEALAARSGLTVFTAAPRTPLLMAMWGAGKLFPRADRSPRMVPHSARALARRLGRPLAVAGRVHRGFYISEAMELAA